MSSGGRSEASVGRGVGFKSESLARVVIVGAGMAGLTAAAKLFHSGVTDLVVLEAQDYVGGRIQAQQVDGQNIDMGAQFVHGQVGNPLYTIAQTLDIVSKDNAKENDDLSPLPRSRYLFHLCSNGERVRDKAVYDFLECIEKDYRNLHPDTLNDTLSAENIYGQLYEHYMKEHGTDMDTRTKELLDAAYRSRCCEIKIDTAADDLSKLSGWASLVCRELSGTCETRLKAGMAQLVQAIVRLLPQAIINTNSPVKSIEWNDGRIKHRKSILTCENGKEYDADYVIVTISSGCLKAGLSMFYPPLPLSFMKALKGLHLGAPEKLYLQWETPFWDCKALLEEMQGDTTISFLWLKSNPIRISCDTTKRKTRSGKAWWEDVFGCELVPDHPDMLEFWFTEEQVRILEQLNDTEVMSVLQELLQHFFINDNIPRPFAIYRSLWRTNPFVRGSYTYPHTSFGRTDMDVLTSPLPSLEDPQLLFAGEAFSLEHIGFAHGAYNSGQQTADVILRSLGIDSSKWTDVSKLIEIYNQSGDCSEAK